MVCQTLDAAEQAVWHSLNNFAYENAAFLAERLHAEVGNENSLSLLATCYFRSGDFSHAYILLSKCIGASQYRLTTPRAKFLLAKCCFQLEKFAEAEDALIGRLPTLGGMNTSINTTSNLNSSSLATPGLQSTPAVNSSNLNILDAANNPDLLSGFGEIESFAYELLANICLRTGRPERAKKFLERAIAVNPLLWNAYAQLCDMGAVKPGQSQTVLRQLNNQNTVAAAINLSSPTSLSEFSLLQMQCQKLPHSTNTQHVQGNLHQFSGTGTNQPSPKLPGGTVGSNSSLQSQSTNLMEVDTGSNTTPATTTSIGSAQPAAKRTSLHQPPPAPAKRAPFRSRLTGSGTVGAVRRTGDGTNLATLASGSTSSISSVGSGSSAVNSRHILASVNPMSTHDPSSNSGGPVRRSQRLHAAAAVKENNRSDSANSSSNAQPSTSSSTTTGTGTGSSSGRVRLRPSTGSTGSTSNVANTTNSSISSTTSSTSSRPRQLRTSTDNENLKTRSQQQQQSGNKTTRDPLGSIHQRIETITDPSKESAEILSFQQQTTVKTTESSTLQSNSSKTPSTASQQSPSIASEDSQRDSNTLSVAVQWKTLTAILPVISRLGAAYASLTSYACHRAIHELDAMPPKHAKTPLVASMLARAHYEAGQIETSVEVYAELHRLDPAWLVGMDRYSSALWRLQRVNDLVHLALDLERVQPLRPQTWIAIGNAMSAEKEHARAIRSFDRAVQLDQEKRGCASYAHSLAGQEHMMGDDLDRAEVRFRKAFACDPRNYTALFGLGQLQHKRKQHHDAVVSLDRAVQVNPGNVTIYTLLALVLHALHHDHSALLAIDRALVLKPKDPSALFNRARIFYCMRQHKDALRVLAELKSVAPREAMAYMLQGKIYEALGDTAQAQLSFIWASQLTAGSAMAVQVRELVCHTAPPPVPLQAGASSSSAIPPSISGVESAAGGLNSSVPGSAGGVMLTGGSSSDSFDFGSLGHRFSAPTSSLVAAMALPGESFTVTMGVNESAVVGGTLGGSDSFLSAAFGGGLPGSADATSDVRDLMHDGDDEEDDDEEPQDDDDEMYNSNNDDDYEDEMERASSSVMHDAPDASYEDALAGDEEDGNVTGGAFDEDDPMTGSSGVPTSTSAIVTETPQQPRRSGVPPGAPELDQQAQAEQSNNDSDSDLVTL